MSPPRQGPTVPRDWLAPIVWVDEAFPELLITQIDGVELAEHLLLCAHWPDHDVIRHPTHCVTTQAPSDPDAP